MNPISITDDNIAFTTHQSLTNPKTITISAKYLGSENIDQNNLVQAKLTIPPDVASDNLISRCCMITVCTVCPLAGTGFAVGGYLSNRTGWILIGVALLIASLVYCCTASIIFFQTRGDTNSFIVDQKAELLPKAKAEAEKRINTLRGDAPIPPAQQIVEVTSSETTPLLPV